MNKLTAKEGINTTAIKGVISRKINNKCYELSYNDSKTIFYSFDREFNIGDEGYFLLILAPVPEAVTYLFDYLNL